MNHDNHDDESKTKTHIFSKLPDDGDSLASNNLLKSGAKEKYQLNPGGPSNRQEAPVPQLTKMHSIIESDVRPTGVQLKKAA